MWRQQKEEAGKRRFGGAVGGSCENSAGLSICEYIWANIWCKPDWILSQNCRNTLPLHKLKN